MNIVYRDKHGRFISARSAKRRAPKNVRSELRGPHGKSVGCVKGFYNTPKPLARAIQQRTPPKPKRVTGKPIIKREIVYVDSDDYDDEEYEEERDEWDDAWDEISDEFPELEALDDLDELAFDEDEWYETA